MGKEDSDHAKHSTFWERFFSSSKSNGKFLEALKSQDTITNLYFKYSHSTLNIHKPRKTGFQENVKINLESFCHKHSSMYSQLSFMCKSHINILKSNKMQLIVVRCLCVYFVGLELPEFTSIKRSNVWFVRTGEGCSPRRQRPLHTKTQSVHLYQQSTHLGKTFSVTKFHGFIYTQIQVKMGGYGLCPLDQNNAPWFPEN